MKNISTLALVATVLVGSLVGCKKSETSSPTSRAIAPKVATPAATATTTAPGTQTLDMLPESAVKLKQGKIVSADLRSLSGDQLQAAIDAASKLDAIEEVSLSGEGVTDKVIEPILNLASLKRLRLPQTRIGDETLSRLAESGRVELLDLTDVSSLTAAGMASIGKMTKLKELNLMNTPVTDAWLISLTKLPSLKKLRLRGTQVTGENAMALAETSIIDLELSETPFGNAGMEAVAKMPKLEKLNLWLTKIDDEGLAKLQGKKSLTLLNLDNVSGVTDASMPVIEALTNLELLHLGGTGITESTVARLKSLQKLKTLFITRLDISEETAESLRKELPQLERFEH